MSVADQLRGFSDTDRAIVLELLKRIVTDPENNANDVTFLRHGKGTLLNTQSPKGGPGGNGLEGSGSIITLLGPLMDRSALTHNSFSFSQQALEYMRAQISLPNSAIRAAIGEAVYRAYLDGKHELYFHSLSEFAGDLGVQRTQVAQQIRALEGIQAVKLDRYYHPDIEQITLSLTKRGLEWAWSGFPDQIGGSSLQVTVDIHLDVVTTIKEVRADQSIDPELKAQWEESIKKLEESLERISEKSPVKAAVEALDTASKATGLFAKTIDLVQRHLPDIVRISESMANNIPGS
jgi:hypothetical protein